MPPNNQQPVQVPQGAASGQQPIAPIEPMGSGPGPITPGQPIVQQQPPKPVNPNTTQNSLLISEIREGMIIMGDGSFRAVIASKSINFDLMSSREREGVEFSYQNFRNCTVLSIG